jgi:5-methylthioadenosine/S-adenosylhomocysteine deaminase
VLDPVRSLVYYARADDVDTVLVDGRPLLIGGRVVTIDEDVLRRRVGVAAERLWSTARERGALDRLGVQ